MRIVREQRQRDLQLVQRVRVRRVSEDHPHTLLTRGRGISVTAADRCTEMTDVLRPRARRVPAARRSPRGSSGQG
jgi:hypothetical protein